MKIIDIIKLAILNLKSNLKMTISILTGLVIIIQIIMISFGYGYSMNKYIIDVVDKNASLKYCTISSGDLPDMQNLNYENNIEGIQKVYKFNIYKFCEDNGLKINNILSENNDISLDVAILEIDNKKYKGINDYSYDFNVDDNVLSGSKNKSVKYDIGVMEYYDNLQISKNEIEELRSKYKKKKVFIQGGYLDGENQIILTDYMLQKFGYDNIKECIGKKVNLYIMTDKGEVCIVNNYKIQGIIDSDLYRINSRKSIPQIIISNADKKYCDSLKNKVFLTSFQQVVNLSENEEELILIPTVEAFEYSEVETLYIFYNKILLGISIVVVISILIFVYMVIYFYFKKRKRYICIQRALGIRNIEMYSLMFYELIIIGIISISISIPMYYKIIKYINKFISSLIYNSYYLNTKDARYSIVVGIVVEMVILTIISIVEYKKSKKYNITNKQFGK